MYSEEIMKFLHWEQASRDTIDFKKAYVDIAEDLIAGLLLSQIVYWHLPNSETGKAKLRVKKEGHLWIAKSRTDWWDEIRITGKQFDRASNILVKKGLIEKKTFKFNGSPTVHIRLLWENFLPKWYKTINRAAEALSDMDFTQRGKSNSPKVENGIYPKGKMEFDQRGKSITENTTEITSKITTDNQSINEASKNNNGIDQQHKKEEPIDRLTDLNNNKKEKTKEQKILELQNIISDKKELPIPVAKPMMMYAERLIDDEIDIDDIISTYYANKEVINEYQFGNILSNVLCGTKRKIRNIRRLLHTAIKNYLNDINEVEHLKESKPKEIVPDWSKERKNEIKEQQDIAYNLASARNRFSDIFNF